MRSNNLNNKTKNTRSLPLMMAVGMTAALMITGCTTKNYVKSQTAPLIQQTNELDDQTATNNRNLQDLSQRSQQGVAQAQAAAATADQKALAAGQSATQAQQSAQDAWNRADSLASVVSNLDTYHQVADVQVHFAFNRAVLTRKDKGQLDQFAGQLGNTKSYILEVTGGTDSVGSKDYNYQLSEQRAEAVVQYLAAKYNIQAHKFYLIGIGKDDAVASNGSAAGRAKNRRVQVQLLTNNVDGTQPAQQAQQTSTPSM
ncbi:MAG TPA: OmpA family protein [Acidobacteriaceae bacterium]|jgi:outer membrane protein OmpA-like peptidoglycan-associated protein|nr:OmpA family protein [Acidobacteriaceae bacterium]